MNTPPTMSTAPLPMAPIKSTRKKINKLEIKPKRLLYMDQEFEMLPREDKSVAFSAESLEIQEKIQSPIKSKRKESPDAKSVAKHVEQNELDNETEQNAEDEITNDRPYNLRQRNKNPIWQTMQVAGRKKIVKKKFEEEKENIQIDNASTSGNETFSNESSRSDPNVPNSLSRKDSSSRGSFTHFRI